jgi:predicted site-specific integrase-resolvase
VNPTIKRLSTQAVAHHAGVSRNTLLRWLKEGKVREPDRDVRGWRAWTLDEAEAVRAYATRIVPAPHKLPTELQVR